MEIIKSIVVALTSPLTFALLLLLIGWLLALTAKRTLSRGCRITAFVWLTVFSQPFFSNLLLYPLEHQIAVRESSTSPKYIHVLACYYNTMGHMTEISRWSSCSMQRNIEAFRLYQASETDTKIVLTGGNFLGHKETNYAETAAAFFESLGVEQSDIVILPVGENTAEEVQEVLRFYDGGPLVVVSSATHLTRLSLMYAPIEQIVSFQPVDYHSDGRLTPHLTLPSLWALTNAQHAFYEYLALAKFHLFS